MKPENYDPGMNPNLESVAIAAAEKVHADWLDGKQTKKNYEDIKHFCELEGVSYDSFLTLMGSYLRPLFEQQPKFRGVEVESLIDKKVMEIAQDREMRNKLEAIWRL